LKKLHEDWLTKRIACCKGRQNGIDTLNLRGATDAKIVLKHLRLDSVPIEQVTLNLESRDRIVPVLRALQHVYSDRKLADHILGLIAGDINGDTRTDTGREGMEYWHICMLAAVRLGCNLTHDHSQDFAENHRKLRAIMGLGDCDETELKWRTIRNHICQLKPETIKRISRSIVGEGHRLEPTAIENVCADSFVMETSIPYRTESRLLYDGIRKIISLCTLLADEHRVSGWRQHAHLLKKTKQLDHKINRIAAKNGSNYKTRMKPFY